MSAPEPHPSSLPLWKHVAVWLIPFAVGALGWALFGPGGFFVGIVVGVVPLGVAYYLFGEW